MNRLDLDTFGDIIDDFLTKIEGKMLITMPEGTQEVTVEDNIGAGSVVQFYFLITAIKTASNAMREEMGIEATSGEWYDIVETLMGMLKKELLKEGEDDD